MPVLLNLTLGCLRAEPCEAAIALKYCERVLDDSAEAELEWARACTLAPEHVEICAALATLRRKLREDKTLPAGAAAALPPESLCTDPTLPGTHGEWDAPLKRSPLLTKPLL